MRMVSDRNRTGILIVFIWLRIGTSGGLLYR
jgi:hypothetical protein